MEAMLLGREKVEGGTWKINCSRMLPQRTLRGAELLGYKGLDLGHGHELMCIVPAWWPLALLSFVLLR